MQASRNDPPTGTNSDDAAKPRPTQPGPEQLAKLLRVSLPQKTRPFNTETLAVKPDKLTAELPEQAKSFHAVEKFRQKDHLRFFKHNVPGSPMSALEAAVWALYHVLIPGYTPKKANAHVDEHGTYIGVSSQLIERFTPAKQARLTEAHLLDPEIVKGNAIGLTASYLFEEDDCHAGNIDLYGDRIDYDMSFWPVLGLFKIGNQIDKFIRSASEAKFRVSAKDIDDFPLIDVSKPHYWPTRAQPFINDNIRDKLSEWANISTNAFSTDENDVYKKLNMMPEFHYYKFRTCLKFLLMTDDIIDATIKQHVPETFTYVGPSGKEVKICEMLRDHVINRRKIFRGVLTSMSTFADFLLEHGTRAMAEIWEEFQHFNEVLQASETRKADKNPNRSGNILINNAFEITEIEEIFNDIYNESSVHEEARAQAQAHIRAQPMSHF